MPNWSEVVKTAVELIREYNRQGIRPTLRQVHYRLASLQAGGYQNTDTHYKKLSEKLVEARKEGLIPWDALADHVRYRLWYRPMGGQVPDPEELIKMATANIGEDPWLVMGKRIVIWLEKDALAETIYHAVSDLYVPLSVSRGYSSWTFIYDNLDILKHEEKTEKIVLYLGDHDPSGLDIERFVEEAISFFNVEFTLKRVALTYEQVRKYNLLPNPTKKADPRAKEYISRYGDECWELDALEPRELQRIVRSAVESYIDRSVWEEVERRNKEAREKAREELRRRMTGELGGD